MEFAEEVFLAKIIHGDGAKVIKVGEVNATTMEGEDDIAKFKDYKPSQLGDSKEAKVPSDPSPPTLPKKEDTEPVSSAEPKKPKVANAPQSGARIFASPLARKLANDHNAGYDGIIVQADIEDYLASSGKGVSAPPTSKPKDKATEAGINYTDLPISQIRKEALSLVSNAGGTYGIKQFCAIINPHNLEYLSRISVAIDRNVRGSSCFYDVGSQGTTVDYFHDQLRNFDR
ncbi:hypothetical protein Sjap_017927 [Stephania japonica]|uniref:Uncharacterized protein n=1 Tax=Stephania japonica TaxID=461633 RepID=A0AAP0NIT6_9MAGN